MKVLIKTKLSAHKYKTPEGYLVCQDAILARTGAQEYYKSEIYETFEGEDEPILVYRNPEEVFAPATLASFEDKPITVEHPDQSVTPENYSALAVGHTRNVRKGKFNNQDVMIADLIITDANAINDIESGVRTDLSCGYDCDITDGDKPQQINIRGNHVALCEQGRAGIAKIIDSKSIKDEQYKGYIISTGSYGTKIIKNDKKVMEVETPDEAHKWVDRQFKKEKRRKYRVTFVNSADKTSDKIVEAKNEDEARKKAKEDKEVFRITDVTIEDSFIVKGFPKKFDKFIEKYPDIEFEQTGRASFKVTIPNKEDKWSLWEELKIMNPSSMEMLKDGINLEFDSESVLDSCSTKDTASLPAQDKNQISGYLSSISKFTKNDTDIFDVIEPLKEMGFDLVREHIDGWRQIDDGRYRKDYFFRIDGYKDVFMISFYVENDGQWKVNEINAYFTGKVKPTDAAPYKSNRNKYVIFEEDGKLKGSSYNNYYLYGDKNKYDTYDDFAGVEELTEYLIDNKDIKRENIIFVKDAFKYKKPSEINKRKLKELNKLLKTINNESVNDDERAEMIAHQKRKIKEKILNQIKTTEAEIDENAEKGLDTNINNWYLRNFDNVNINEEVTFNDLFNALDNKESVYNLLGVDKESGYKIVKNCLTKLAELINAPYDYVYEQWMSYED